MHEKFGLGKVIDVSGAGDQVKATVSFEGNNIYPNGIFYRAIFQMLFA